MTIIYLKCDYLFVQLEWAYPVFGSVGVVGFEGVLLELVLTLVL
jgi:hypothetical protein